MTDRARRHAALVLVLATAPACFDAGATDRKSVG